MKNFTRVKKWLTAIILFFPLFIFSQTEPVFENLVSEATVCQGESFTFDATVSNISIAEYSWDVLEVTTPILTVSEAGVYTVTVTDVDGYQFHKLVELSKSEYRTPYFELGELALCGEGAKLELLPLDEFGLPIDFANDYIFTWTASKYQKYAGSIPLGHEHDRTITIDQPGGYTLTVTTPDGECEYTSPAIGILRESLKFLPTGYVCSDNGVYGLKAIVEYGIADEFYWTSDQFYDPENPDATPLISQSPFLNIIESGTYYLVARTMSGCWLEFSSEINIVPKPVLNPVSSISTCASGQVSVDVELSYTWGPDIISNISYTLYDPEGNVYAAAGSVNPFTAGGRSHTFNIGQLTVEKSGTWSVTAEFGGCTSEAQYFDIAITPIPDIQLGGDRMLCEETKTLIVKANVGEEDGALFEWVQNGLPMGITANQITVYESGTYGVSVELNGCFNYDEVDVVQAGEDLNLLGGIAQICDGDDYVIDASLKPGILDSYYEWYKDDILINGVNTPSITVNEAAIYKVYITDNLSGCSHEEEFELTVIKLDEIGIGDNIEITACDGELGFSPDPIFEGATYLWTVNDEHGNYKDSQEGTFFTYKQWYEIDFQYTVEAYIGSCISEQKHFTLTSGKTPNFTFSAYNESCSLSTLKIENNEVPGTDFTWYRGEDDITNEVAVQDPSLLTFETTISGEYKVVGENDYCDLTKVVQVTVFDNQGIIEEEDITLCNGETSLHDITIPNALFYIVDGIERKPDADVKVIVELKNQGLHSFQIRTTDGCDLYDEVSVTLQTLDIDLGPDRIACVGETLIIEAVGDIAESYEWYIDGVLIMQNTGTIEYLVEREGMVKLIAKKGGCEVIDEIGIHIHEDPELNLSNYEVCRSELPITMDATVAIPGAIYQWNDMNDTDPGYDNPVRTITTEEAVAGENVYQINIHTPQCTYTRDVIIDVYPDPSFNLGDDISGCLAVMPQLTINLESGVSESVASYEWYYALDNTGSFVPASGANQSTLAAFENGHYKAVVTTIDGCTFEDEIYVDYALIPMLELIEQIPLCDDPCAKPSIEVVVSNIESFNSLEYTWTLPDATTIRTNEPWLGATIDGEYIVSVSSEYGCVRETSINIALNNPVVSHIGDSDLFDLPSNSSVMLANSVNYAGYFYNWYNDGALISGESEFELFVDEDGVYVLDVVYNIINGESSCSFSATSDPVNISFSSEEQNLLIEERSIGVSDTARISTYSDHASYLWSTGETTSEIVFDAKDYGIGEYALWVEVTDYAGSLSKKAESGNSGTKIITRDEVKVIVSGSVSLEEFGAKIIISPNPVKDIVNIDLNGMRYKRLNVEVLSVEGKIVLNNEFAAINLVELNMSGLASGTYVIRVYVDGKVIERKIIKR